MHSHVSSKINFTSISFALLMGIAVLSLWSLEGYAAATPPTLPQTYINTTYSAPTGATCTAANSSAFQTCLNNSALNSTIVLQAGITYTGPFTLPNKTSGSGWIYIVSSNLANLPASGNRVSPANASDMPTIAGTSAGGNAIKTTTSSHHYRFVGIEIKPASNNFLYNLVQIGNSDTSLSTLPNNITFDRCFIHGDPSVGGRRGVAMDGYDIAVIDSYVSDFKEKGADTQALWAYNSPGPLKIFNNYLEAAGENVMFGGADSRITNLVPSDIEIKRNHFFKPLSWMSASWSVKNHLEFKNAQRVLVEGNIFENNWPHAQNGMSILLTPRNETGGMPWAAAKDITIRLNKLVNVGQAFNVSGTDSNYPELGVLTRRVLIENNQINVTGIGNADGRMFQIINGPIDFTIDHNTGFCTGPLGVSENSPKADQFVFTNNITTKGSYGFTGSGTGEGTATLNAYYTTWQFTKNAIIVGTSGNYPSGNYFPANTGAVGFINYAAADYRLSASSPYKNAGADGKDLGADIDAIEAAIAGIGIPQAPKSLRLIQ